MYRGKRVYNFMEIHRKLLHTEETLSRFGDDLDLYKELLSDFDYLNEFSKKRLQEYLAKKNFAQLKRIIHKLKGVSGTIGAERLYDSLRDFEKLLLAEDIERLETEIIHLDDIYTKTCAEIMQFLKES